MGHPYRGAVSVFCSKIAGNVDKNALPSGDRPSSRQHQFPATEVRTRTGPFLLPAVEHAHLPMIQQASDQAMLWYQTNPPVSSGNIECRTDFHSPVLWFPILEGDRVNWIPPVSPVPRNCDKVIRHV